MAKTVQKQMEFRIVSSDDAVKGILAHGSGNAQSTAFVAQRIVMRPARYMFQTVVGPASEQNRTRNNQILVLTSHPQRENSRNSTLHR